MIQNNWQFINQDSFMTGHQNDEVASMITLEAQERMIQFANQQLLESQPRDDYRELLELSIIFLGGTPDRGIHFLSPGPMHHARWMSKLIYAYKVWMFQDQFKLTKKEELGLRHLCVFGVLAYIEAWFSCRCAAKAPSQDIKFMKNLIEFPLKSISTVTSRKFQKHLWYLSEELIALSLFDDEVSNSEKKKIVQSIHENTEPGNNDNDDEPLKKSTKDTELFSKISLHNFVGPHTVKFFDKLQITISLLNLEIEQWSNSDAYKCAKK